MGAYINVYHKKLKAFLAPEIKKPAPLNFLDIKDTNKILVLSSPQSRLPNLSSVISIDDCVTDVGLVLSIKVSGPAILLKS